MRDGRLRRAERRAVIEGPHLLAAALSAGIEPVAVFGTEAGLAKPEVTGLVRNAVVLSPGVFRTIADAETPPGVAAEVPIPELKGDSPAVFLEGIQDAGNVGAIIRSAAAFGVQILYLDRGCADPWSPKVLRAGMGGHFVTALRQVEDLPAAIREARVRLLSTVVRGGRPLREVDLSGRVGWAFGAEGAGLSPAILNLGSEKVTIPMAGGESLNVAAAAAVCFYEAFCR